jgi:hypothetical protein
VTDNPNQPAKKSDSPYQAYALIAFVSAAGSAGIAFIVFVLAHWTNLTEGGVWALASTVFAPAIMGIGVSFWVYMTAASHRNAQSNESRESDPKNNL